jgi:hypothetical protein
MKVGDQTVSELSPLTKAQWRIVILGIILDIAAIVGIVVGGIYLADAIWP